MSNRLRTFASVAISATALATLLAACGGGSSAPATSAGSGAMMQLPPASGGDSTQSLHIAAAGLTVKPTTMTFKNSTEQQAQLTPNTDFYSETNTCVKKHILKSVKYFSYGIYEVTPGKTNGDCSVTFTDTTSKAKATMKVVNSAN